MMGRRSVGVRPFENGGFGTLLDIKTRSRVHIDKSIYDFVHHAGSV